MKKRRILVPLITVTVVLLLVTLFSFVIFADGTDYSRPGTTNKITLNSVDILREIGIELSDDEAEYLSLYGEYSISYGSRIPTSGIKTVYDEEAKTLRVFSEPYVYKAANGLDVTWIPELAMLNGTAARLIHDGNTGYVAEFSSVVESDEHKLKLIYKTEISVAANILNTLLNKPYDDAEAWAKYRDYLLECDIYDQKMMLYQSYLSEKRAYSEALDAYTVYLDELSDYEADKLKYDEYLVRLAEYNAEYEKYSQYLKDLEKYNKKLEEYNQYVENIAIVKSHLAIMDGTTKLSTSHNRSVYNAIHGNLVKMVMENKDLVDNDFVGGDGKAIDSAGEATEALKAIYAEYKACADEGQKYTYYAVNYTKIRDNFVKLFNSLDKLYQNSKVRLAIKEEGYKDKFEIFLAQLYYVAEAFSDTPVINFNGTGYYDSSYKINRRTPLEILEGKEYILDTGSAEPLAKGYPTPCEEPTIVEVSEPVPPTPVAKPEPPVEVKNPGKAPTEVVKPVSPSYVASPIGLTDKSEIPGAAKKLISLYDSGKLVRRPEFSLSQILSFAIEVEKALNAPSVEATFCAEDGTVLYTTVVDRGSYAEFIGEIPKKAETAEYTYSFIGWKTKDGVPVDVTSLMADSSVMLYPNFKETKRVYDVYWELEDGVVITQCEYGKTPSIGYTPKKADSGKYIYKFSGWNKRVMPVVGDSAKDRYSVTFKSQYLVPLRDELFSEDIGGAVVTVDGDEWIIDCSVNSVGSSYSSLRVDLSNILPRVVSNGKLTVKTLHYTARFSYSDVELMNERGVGAFYVMPVKGLSDYTFTPKFFNKNGKELKSNLRVNLEFNSFRTSNAENSKIFYETESGRIYASGKVEKNALTVYALAGYTYHVAPEYAVEVLKNGPVTLTLDKNFGTAGTEIKFTCNYDPGIEIFSIYFISPRGMRTEIVGDSFTVPDGGGFIGVDYDYLEYTVNFISAGRIIGTRVYRYGEIPEMMVAPVRTSDGRYTYTFEKWINSATQNDEIRPVTKNVNYEALYTRTPVPEKPPQEGLLVSDSVLRKLVLIGTLGVFFLICVIPCTIISLVKMTIIIRRKPRGRVKKQKNNVTRVEDKP